MFNHHDINRDACMLHGPLAHHGYDWWWHSFTAQDAVTGEDKPFFIEFFVCNPALGGDEPVLGQLPANRAAGKQPSYLMVKAGTWGADHCQLHRFFAWIEKPVVGYANRSCCCFSVIKSCPTLRSHGLQHTRSPCPSLSPGICSDSWPLSREPSHPLPARSPLALNLSRHQGLFQ